MTFVAEQGTFFSHWGLPLLGATVGPTSNSPVTQLLSRWNQGDSAARDALVSIVYQELRRVARKCLASQPSDHTLQPTALVHEAYLRLVNAGSVNWQGRVHFFAVAATIMRHILVDHARKHSAKKRNCTLTLLVEEGIGSTKTRELDLLALDDALQKLAVLDPRQSRIVELRFFGGLSIEETAEVVEISPATTKREWATAKLWLHDAITAGVAT